MDGGIVVLAEGMAALRNGVFFSVFFCFWFFYFFLVYFGV